MPKLTKNYKLTRQKLQKGGALMCPSDLESTEPNAATLREFVNTLKDASNVAEVSAVFDKLKEKKEEVKDIIIAMPDDFCNRAGTKKEHLKKLLGEDGKVSNLLVDTVDYAVFTSEPAVSTSMSSRLARLGRHGDDGREALAATGPGLSSSEMATMAKVPLALREGVEEGGPAGAGEHAGVRAGSVGGARKKRTSKKSSKTKKLSKRTSKRLSKKTSKKTMKGGAKKVSKKSSKKLPKKSSKKSKTNSKKRNLRK